MKRLIMFGLLLAVACGVQAKPYYTYDLQGTVTGDAGAAEALADVDLGDQVAIRLKIWHRTDGGHKVAFYGQIGGWMFPEQSTEGEYIWGDWHPERFGTNGSVSLIDPPAGNGSTIVPYDIYLTLFGMDWTGTEYIPEEDWMVRDTGEINLERFHSGSFEFGFHNREAGSGHGTEEDLYGSITRITEVTVPEPGVLMLVALGSVLVVVRVFHPHKQALAPRTF